MSKNEKVIKYLRETGRDDTRSSNELYLFSKTLGFQLWDIKRSWNELINELLNIFK
jgi:hypothetical protein